MVGSVNSLCQILLLAVGICSTHHITNAKLVKNKEIAKQNRQNANKMAKGIAGSEIFCIFAATSSCHEAVINLGNTMIKEQHVALFLDKNLKKAQFATKYLAAFLATRPVIVHAYVRNGRDMAGKVLSQSTVKALTGIVAFLTQSQQTFKAIDTTGSLVVNEISQDIPQQQCIDELTARLHAEGKDGKLIVLDEEEYTYELVDEKLRS